MTESYQSYSSALGVRERAGERSREIWILRGGQLDRRVWHTGTGAGAGAGVAALFRRR